MVDRAIQWVLFICFSYSVVQLFFAVRRIADEAYIPLWGTRLESTDTPPLYSFFGDTSASSSSSSDEKVTSDGVDLVGIMGGVFRNTLTVIYAGTLVFLRYQETS